jgi:uncharacterized protein
MLYAILARDSAESLPRRAKTRPSHLEYLGQLVDQGRVVLAGPHPAIDSPEPGEAGYSGSLIVAEFESLEDAQEWAGNDPYMLSGVFASVEIKPFVQVVP